MKIRAITVGTNVRLAGERVELEPHIIGFINDALHRFRQAGIEVQTTRLASQSVTQVVPAEREAVVDFARELEAAGQAAGFGFTSMGPANPDELAYVPHLAEALLSTESVSGTVVIGDRARGVSRPAVSAAAEVILQLAHGTPDGFGNLRFAGLANCPPNIPFFPAGYHDGGSTTFGIAWEAADLAVDAATTAANFDQAIETLLHLIEREGERIAAIGTLLAEQHGLRFGGIDLSLAPFPETAASIGEAFERLGVDVFGAPGTLYVASAITDVLRRARLPRLGYSGLMLPVLEDPVLARRAAERTYRLNDLLLYSAVCGLGLDVVPLPGEVGLDELRGILLDVAALAVRLDKPLTVRLLPVPGLLAGDPVSFDFAYFAPAVVMPVSGYGAGRLFEPET